MTFKFFCTPGIWDKIVQKVAKLREDAAMLKLFTDHVKGEEMYGLTVHAVMRITESVSHFTYCPTDNRGQLSLNKNLTNLFTNSFQEWRAARTTHLDMAAILLWSFHS